MASYLQLHNLHETIGMCTKLTVVMFYPLQNLSSISRAVCLTRNQQCNLTSTQRTFAGAKSMTEIPNL